MKKTITLLLFTLALAAGSLQAQEIDESYLFVDEDGEIIENGSTIIRNVVEVDEVDGSELINSGLYVFNMDGGPNDYIKMHYNILRIDNGTFQICFPITCNMKSEVGLYETAIGQLMNDLQDLQSEWFPVADGECEVTLSIEIFTREGFFPPSYVHKSYGPTITLRFIKGDVPSPGIPGDVNGDNEVNIADINAVIDIILTGESKPAADVNGDNEINIADINAVIDIILQ